MLILVKTTRRGSVGSISHRQRQLAGSFVNQIPQFVGYAIIDIRQLLANRRGEITVLGGPTALPTGSTRRPHGLLPPTTAVDRSRLRPTSWAMISGLKPGQLLTSLRL